MDFDLPESAIAVRDGVAAIAAKYDHDYWYRCEDGEALAQGGLARAGRRRLARPRRPRGVRRRRAGPARDSPSPARPSCASGGTAGVLPLRAHPRLRRHHARPARHRGAEAALLPGLAAGDVRSASPSPSRTPAPTRSRSAPGPPRRATTSWSRARRSGSPAWSAPTGWCSSPAPSRRPRPSPARPASRSSSSTSRRPLADGTLTYTPIPKMGTNILASNQVFLDDVRVPADRRDRRGRRGLRGAVGHAQPRADHRRGRWGRRRGAALRVAVGLREATARCSAGRSAPTRRSRSRSPRSRPRPSWPG